MKVTLTINSTKPSGVQFFSQSSDANKALTDAINTFTESQPGFISQTTTNPTSDTRQVAIIFDTVENYANWMSARAKLPEQVARVAYNKANGITSTLNETIS